MAKIIPFKGLRYTGDDIRELITPPYDVIGPQEQEAFYQRSPYNIIRLEYGITRPDDHQQDNRYTRAADTLKSWLDKGVLAPEEEKVFYFYEQSYTYDGVNYRRTGIIAALQAEPFENKAVLPHEETLQKPKSDRLDLLRSCRANFSPIFGLFSDPREELGDLLARGKKGSAVIDITDDEDQRHQVWMVADLELQKALTEFMASRPVFIADGHHRYETALAFSQETDLTESPGCAFTLAILVSLQDPGLIVLPTHRLVRDLTEEQLSELSRIAGESFEINDRGATHQLDLASFLGELKKMGETAPAFGLLLDGKALLLTLKDMSGEEDNLDLSILKQRLLLPLFKGNQGAVESHVSYTRDAAEAMGEVSSGKTQAAFLMNPTPMEEVTKRALKGERMPQKSTYFFPKLPSGLVVHHLDLSHR